jgi:hypothetical protein
VSHRPDSYPFRGTPLPMSGRQRGLQAVACEGCNSRPRKSCALSTTPTVETLIRIAARPGGIVRPNGAARPAATGRASAL